MRTAGSCKAAQTRRKILGAALHEFAERGYAGASVQQIADRAHVTKPALYYHFGSKAGLFRALVDLVEEKFEELVIHAQSQASRLPGQLTEVCAALFDFSAHHGEIVRLALSYSAVTRGAAPVQAHCPEKAQHRVAMMERLMRRGLRNGDLSPRLKSPTLARCFLGMIEFHITACLAGSGACSTRRAARELVSLFLRGAGTRNGLERTDEVDARSKAAEA